MDIRTDALDDVSAVLRSRNALPLPGMPEPLSGPESAPGAVLAPESWSVLPLFAAPQTIRGQLAIDTDEMPTREGMRANVWERSRGAWS